MIILLIKIDKLCEWPFLFFNKVNVISEEDDVEEIENDSQEEDLSQDEEEEKGANSQSEDQSQSQEEGSPRGGDTKTRRRRARKAD